jgi:DNA-binding MarR family transcriptional regulator
LLVRPFDYRAAADFWGITDPRLAVLVHSVVGGTPAYRRAFVRGDAPTSIEDFDPWVIRTVLNPDVPIFREARYLLAEETEIREPALYNSVLGAIAAGNTTRGGIANYIGRRDSDLTHPLNVLEDAGLVARESDPFHARRSTFKVTEPLLVFYEAVMRRSWTLLEQRHAPAVWANAKASFLSQVVGPHFEALCREFALRPDSGLFDELAGEVAAGTIPDPANRTKIEVDVAVLAPGLPGERRRVLSLGEAKWNKVMGLRHLGRLRRARDLLSRKGFDVADAVLACYSGAGFDEALCSEARRGRVRLVDVGELYRPPATSR